MKQSAAQAYQDYVKKQRYLEGMQRELEEDEARRVEIRNQRNIQELSESRKKAFEEEQRRNRPQGDVDPEDDKQPLRRRPRMQEPADPGGVPDAQRIDDDVPMEAEGLAGQGQHGAAEDKEQGRGQQNIDDVLNAFGNKFFGQQGPKSQKDVAWPSGDVATGHSTERELKDKERLGHELPPRAPEVQKLGFIHDEAKATLRPQFGIAGESNVVPTVEDQIRSDVMFDMFGIVQPGYGEGTDNKMFLQQEQWKDTIQWGRPMFQPNIWLGNLNYQHPMPWQWQNIKHPRDIQKHLNEQIRRTDAEEALILRQGEGSVQAFGRDTPEVILPVSASGLKRDPRTPFEPVIQTQQPWIPLNVPPSKDLERLQGFKRIFSAHRNPRTMERQQHNGGPTLRPRRALEIVLP